MRMNWNAPGSRLFEIGVDRGVLFVPDHDGVPWNGLISVTENKSGGTAKAYYQDGDRVRTRVAPTEFSATLKAYASPELFDKVDGTSEIYDGFYSTQQPRKPFGLSYRTLVGNDVESHKLGYKIHLIYNAYAEPADHDHQTMSDALEANSLTWDISATPVIVGAGHRPTPHFVIDSRRVSPQILASVEDAIYGSATTTAHMPTIPELLAIFASYTTFRATILGDGFWSAEGSNVTSLGNGKFTLDDPSITVHGDGSFSIEVE